MHNARRCIFRDVKHQLQQMTSALDAATLSLSATYCNRTLTVTDRCCPLAATRRRISFKYADVIPCPSPNIRRNGQDNVITVSKQFSYRIHINSMGTLFGYIWYRPAGVFCDDRPMLRHGQMPKCLDLRNKSF